MTETGKSWRYCPNLNQGVHMLRFLGVLIAMVVSSAAVAQQGTTIKGYYLGMQEIKSTEFDKKVGGDGTIYLMPKNAVKDMGILDACAKFEMDQTTGVVKTMIFYKCMFGARDLTDEQFARALVENYKLPTLSCQTYTYRGYDDNFKMTTLVGKKCTAFSTHGELVTIDGGSITLEQRDKKPTFN
ncbi:hypothetical protein [Bradyrhizobium diazoefficiens]